tara:strand:- start:6829 stop:7737 length:909 start_codon:yes stop_codon:yes gene_type:complete
MSFTLPSDSDEDDLVHNFCPKDEKEKLIFVRWNCNVRWFAIEPLLYKIREAKRCDKKSYVIRQLEIELDVAIQSITPDEGERQRIMLREKREATKCAIQEATISHIGKLAKAKRETKMLKKKKEVDQRQMQRELERRCIEHESIIKLNKIREARRRRKEERERDRRAKKLSYRKAAGLSAYDSVDVILRKNREKTKLESPIKLPPPTSPRPVFVSSDSKRNAPFRSVAKTSGIPYRIKRKNTNECCNMERELEHVDEIPTNNSNSMCDTYKFPIMTTEKSLSALKDILQLCGAMVYTNKARI